MKPEIKEYYNVISMVIRRPISLTDKKEILSELFDDGMTFDDLKVILNELDKNGVCSLKDGTIKINKILKSLKRSEL